MSAPPPVVDPQPLTREARLTLAAQICHRLREVHAAALLAVGVYGSTARGTDGPYSDLELFCVLRTSGEDYAHEWTHGPWKAEVDVYSAGVLLARAAQVDGRWPLTHGAYQAVLPLYDPTAFFARLRAAATSQPDEHFRRALAAVVVGDLYEDVAKVRNARAAGHTAALAQETVEIATNGAYAIGLANRRCFTTGARKLEEALVMPDRPDGYEPLARMVMAGTLSDPDAVGGACERFWHSLVAWVERRGITLAEPRRIPF